MSLHYEVEQIRLLIADAVELFEQRHGTRVAWTAGFDPGSDEVRVSAQLAHAEPITVWLDREGGRRSVDALRALFSALAKQARGPDPEPLFAALYGDAWPAPSLS